MTDTLDIEKERRRKSKKGNSSWTVRECLEQTIYEIDKGYIDPKSALLIFYDKEVTRDEDREISMESYSYSWRAVRMSGADMILVLEAAKSGVLEDMGFRLDPDERG